MTYEIAHVVAAINTPVLAVDAADCDRTVLWNGGDGYAGYDDTVSSSTGFPLDSEIAYLPLPAGKELWIIKTTGALSTNLFVGHPFH